MILTYSPKFSQTAVVQGTSKKAVSSSPLFWNFRTCRTGKNSVSPIILFKYRFLTDPLSASRWKLLSSLLCEIFDSLELKAVKVRTEIFTWCIWSGGFVPAKKRNWETLLVANPERATHSLKRCKKAQHFMMEWEELRSKTQAVRAKIPEIEIRSYLSNILNIYLFVSIFDSRLIDILRYIESWSRSRQDIGRIRSSGRHWEGNPTPNNLSEQSASSSLLGLTTCSLQKYMRCWIWACSWRNRLEDLSWSRAS